MRSALLALLLFSACVGPGVFPDNRLAPDAVENIRAGALDYSWSGPFKVNALANVGGAFVLLVGADDTEGRNLAIGSLLIASLFDLGIALALDNSASEAFANVTREGSATPAAKAEEDFETLRRKVQEIERRQQQEAEPTPATPQAQPEPEKALPAQPPRAPKVPITP